MVNPIKRDRAEASVLVPTQETTQSRFKLLLSLNEATEKADKLFHEIAAASFRIPEEISTSFQGLFYQIRKEHNPTPTRVSNFFSCLEKFESFLKNQTTAFNEIIDRSSKLIEKINKLSPLDKDSLPSASVISDLISNLKQIECDFIDVGSILQNFSEEVQKPVLELHLAIELESARVKYLEIREFLSDNGLLGSSDLLRPIPRFFLNLDIFNYQRVLLPVAHRLSRDKYLSQFRFSGETTVVCRELTGIEKDRIKEAYSKIPDDLKKILEGYAEDAGYDFPKVEDDAEKYYRISAKVLREWIHTFPNLEPKVVDPRRFASLEKDAASLLEDLDDASDSKDNDEEIAYSSSRGYAPARFGAATTPSLPPHTGSNLDPRSFEAQLHLHRCFISSSEQVDRKPSIGSCFTFAGQSQLEPVDLLSIDQQQRRLFEGYMAALNDQDRMLYIRSQAENAHDIRELFDSYIAAAIEDTIQAGIHSGELPPSTRELPIGDYINVLSNAIEHLCSTTDALGMDDDVFPMDDPSIESSALPPEDPDLVEIYTFIVQDLGQLTEEEKTDSLFLEALMKDLILPAPFLQKFYANVRKVATETGQLPLEAEDDWAERNYSTSYLFIQQGLFRTVSEILTEDTRKIFDTWVKVYTMPEPRNEAAVRSIIESQHFSDAQVTRFYEEVKRVHLRNHPETQESDLPHSWPQDNAYTDYSRTLCALSLLLVHEFSTQRR